MKRLFLLLLLLCTFTFPLVSFKTNSGDISKSTKFKPTLTYVGDNANPSHLGRYYAIYTDGTTNIVQVTDYSSNITYTATGNTYLSGSFTYAAFTVYSGVVAIDTYNGKRVF
jgi:hypothetical protein